MLTKRDNLGPTDLAPRQTKRSLPDRTRPCDRALAQATDKIVALLRPRVRWGFGFREPELARALADFDASTLWVADENAKGR